MKFDVSPFFLICSPVIKLINYNNESYFNLFIFDDYIRFCTKRTTQNFIGYQTI